MSGVDDIARICARLKHLHEEILNQSGVDEVELLEAATALREMEEAAEDLAALDVVLDSFESFRGTDFPAWYMRHELDVRPGLNVYHPVNGGKACLAIYFPECMYLQIGYGIRKKYSKDRKRKWYFEWEWRPPEDIIKRKKKDNPDKVKAKIAVPFRTNTFKLVRPKTPVEKEEEDARLLQRDRPDSGACD